MPGVLPAEFSRYRSVVGVNRLRNLCSETSAPTRVHHLDPKPQPHLYAAPSPAGYASRAEWSQL